MSPQLRARERERGERKPSAGMSSTYWLSTGPRNTHNAGNFYTPRSTSPLALLILRSLCTQGHYPSIPAKRLWLWGGEDLPEVPHRVWGSSSDLGSPTCLHASPMFHAAEAGNNDTVWATGDAPDVPLHQRQPSDGREQCRDIGTEEEHCLGMRGLRHLASQRGGSEPGLEGGEGAFRGKHRGFGRHLAEAGTRKAHVGPQVWRGRLGLLTGMESQPKNWDVLPWAGGGSLRNLSRIKLLRQG